MDLLISNHGADKKKKKNVLLSLSLSFVYQIIIVRAQESRQQISVQHYNLLSGSTPILRTDSLKNDPRGGETGTGRLSNSFYYPGSFWCQKLKGKPDSATLLPSYEPDQACEIRVIFVLKALALR
ncbi:hypothetical protein XENOCAPTIV_013852 [Xenoophorus captivus]|uniref:Uncharacterized protein n=1 Tax=Xenoophorus captivus TaxID=1517983 RepID=A0ABV0QRQ5_9TELE